uniref:Uncharacterized protein n=1 Tax=Globisporangium ultimum (strain ATCC 200006 / CBS 805.95 / DAOM BR144) TaxID=431595 RepID=K3WJY9_GLOUD
MNNVVMPSDAFFLHATRDVDLRQMEKLHAEYGDDFLSAVDAKDHNDTHAHIAARGGHLFLLKWLHKHSMAIDTSNDLGDTCAHEAALWGHLGILTWLYQETPFDIFAVRNRKSLSVFHHAANAGHLGVLQWLHHQHPVGIWHEDHNLAYNGSGLLTRWFDF